MKKRTGVMLGVTLTCAMWAQANVDKDAKVPDQAPEVLQSDVGDEYGREEATCKSGGEETDFLVSGTAEPIER